jgi:hypothetical protein
LPSNAIGSDEGNKIVIEQGQVSAFAVATISITLVDDDDYYYIISILNP